MARPQPQSPPRLSVLAVAALALGAISLVGPVWRLALNGDPLICKILFGVGLLAAFLGAWAAGKIRQSKERQKGTGIAWAAVGLGLVGWIANSLTMAGEAHVASLADEALAEQFETVRGDLHEINRAIEEHFAEHGVLPDDLSGLAMPTAQLERLPLDPFQDGSPFRYHPAQTVWLLLSPGADADFDVDASSVDGAAGEELRTDLMPLYFDPTNGAGSSGDIWRVGWIRPPAVPPSP